MNPWIMRLALAATIMAQASTGSASDAGSAEEKDKGVAEKIEDTARKVGKKIEQGFNKAADKLEEKRVGEKIEQKLNKAVKKTGEGFEKAGKKIQELAGEKEPAETKKEKETQQPPGH